MKALHKYIQCGCSPLLATCSCKYQRSMCIATGVTSITRNREIFLCSSCLFFSSPNVHNQYIQIQLCLPLFHMSLLKGQDPHPGTGRPAPTLYPPVSCLGSGLQNAPPATCRQILSSLRPLHTPQLWLAALAKQWPPFTRKCRQVRNRFS